MEEKDTNNFMNEAFEAEDYGDRKRPCPKKKKREKKKSSFATKVVLAIIALSAIIMAVCSIILVFSFKNAMSEDISSIEEVSDKQEPELKEDAAVTSSEQVAEPAKEESSDKRQPEAKGDVAVTSSEQIAEPAKEEKSDVEQPFEVFVTYTGDDYAVSYYTSKEDCLSNTTILPCKNGADDMEMYVYGNKIKEINVIDRDFNLIEKLDITYLSESENVAKTYLFWNDDNDKYGVAFYREGEKFSDYIDILFEVVTDSSTFYIPIQYNCVI